MLRSFVLLFPPAATHVCVSTRLRDPLAGPALTCPGELNHAETNLENGCFLHGKPAPNPLYTALPQRRGTAELTGHPDTDRAWMAPAQVKRSWAQHCPRRSAAPRSFHATVLAKTKTLMETALNRHRTQDSASGCIITSSVENNSLKGYQR